VKELIISAYDRDYQWVSNLDRDVKVTVYRKGSNIQNNETYLSNNVGRDVHTFFYHFYKNYYTLSDYTITSQDFPFDHVDNYIPVINGGVREWENNAIMEIGECWFFNRDHIYERVLECDHNGMPHHGGLDIKGVWNQLFETSIPYKINFVPAGHFCISREAVHKRPVEFYEKVVNILETNDQSPWIIERLEPYIFDTNFKIK